MRAKSVAARHSVHCQRHGCKVKPGTCATLVAVAWRMAIAHAHSIRMNSESLLDDVAENLFRHSSTSELQQVGPSGLIFTLPEGTASRRCDSQQPDGVEHVGGMPTTTSTS